MTRIKITVRLRLKCDSTQTRFLLYAKQTSPFKSAGASVQSTTGSRDVRISGSNIGYTKFWGSVKSAGYPLHSPVSRSFPLPCVTLCHHISNTVYLSNDDIHSRSSRNRVGLWTGFIWLTMCPVAGCCRYGTEHSTCDDDSYWLVVGNEGSQKALCSIQVVIRLAYSACKVSLTCGMHTVIAICCQVKGDRNCVKETAQLSRGRSQLALEFHLL